MSFLGQDDGYQALSTARATAESRVADARRQPARHLVAPRWPGGVTLLRVFGLVLGAIVLLGWILTALNG